MQGEWINGKTRTKPLLLSGNKFSLCKDLITIINKRSNLKEYKAIISTMIVNSLIRKSKLVSSFSKSDFQPQVGYTQSSSSVSDFVTLSDDLLAILWFISPPEGI